MKHTIDLIAIKYTLKAALKNTKYLIDYYDSDEVDEQTKLRRLEDLDKALKELYVLSNESKDGK